MHSVAFVCRGIVILLGATLAVCPLFADTPTQDAMEVELSLFQGLWQTHPGGMEHQGGSQVVQNPVPDGPCFFICKNRLIWLDHEGKPTGKEEVLALDLKATPRKITFAPVGDQKNEKPSHGIYRVTATSLTVHLGLDGGPAPRQFLELNKPLKGNDGSEWIVSRKVLIQQPPNP